MADKPTAREYVKREITALIEVERDIEYPIHLDFDAQITALIEVEREQDSGEVDFDADFDTKLNIHAATLLDIIIELENKYKIKFKDDEIEAINTPNQLLDACCTKLGIDLTREDVIAEIRTALSPFTTIKDLDFDKSLGDYLVSEAAIIGIIKQLNARLGTQLDKGEEENIDNINDLLEAYCAKLGIDDELELPSAHEEGETEERYLVRMDEWLQQRLGQREQASGVSWAQEPPETTAQAPVPAAGKAPSPSTLRE